MNLSRRTFLGGAITAATVLSIIRQAESLNNKISGGAFSTGLGTDNIISGDETTGQNSRLVSCVVNGRGAARNTSAISTTMVGDGAGCNGVYSLTDLYGQFSGLGARLHHVSASGYATCEHADISRGALNGLYSGHSMYGRAVNGSGLSVFNGAIVSHATAQGEHAGSLAEGRDLVMIGDYVTTAQIAGERFPVSAIHTSEKLTPWVVKNHRLGLPGQRINLFVFGDEMPKTNYGPFINGSMRPFVVLGRDEIGYCGNKYAATSEGKNVTVAINTNRPNNSVAIGAGSSITRSNQVVINGQDVTGQNARLSEMERKINDMIKRIGQ